MSFNFIQEAPGRKFQIEYSSFHIKILKLPYLLHLLFLIILDKVVLWALADSLLARGRVSDFLKS
jgi:hypothetical protein